MVYFQRGSATDELSSNDLKSALFTALEKLGTRKKVLAIPPDFTRFHSKAGELTAFAWQYYKENLTDILPALGTHVAMTGEEINHMFPGVPHDLFRVHDWRNDVVTLGTVPGEYINEITEGRINYDWPAQVNKMLVEGGYDLILSIGQVVPHEVIGMANYNKNIFVGTGGAEGINKSHFIGAAYGMERIMGRASNPVRRVLNYASEHFASEMPIIYVQTVIGRNDKGKLVTRGIFIGDDEEVFEMAADLSIKVNFEMVEKPLKKVVVYLDPSEFRSTWLGNKSIYRTRMALADGAELIVLAPALKEFGEDSTIDKLIRKYGYCGTPKTLEYVEKNDDMKNNLGAAAHLIHGSSEGRFSVTYCPGHLTKEEIESVFFNYADLKEMMKLYDPEKLKDGFNTMPDGEEIFYISNPAVGLWAHEDRFKD
ncbi:lactate racemase domain-containing protein [Alkalitalea saponilacus]|uniref:Nickel-dependent lactate racemase n=1 Tax=Alkalitalea saponilacus TaxID=889453 RepID=A0A1T5G6E9_9BACT|nr:lactate racemase domain-containing protein [Alkalitalea saponilacus]ASB47869.1 D-mannonate epimerase [Alkalitalea saponilacus]SKC03911.1 Nickel-dependent lactate racemase [Alkalitalea saponilacus]